MERRINFRRVFLIAGLASLIVSGIALWLRMASSHAERTGSDFISPFTAGRIAHEWGMSHVYDLDLQKTIQQEVVGFELAPGQVLMFNHPPYLVPLLYLLVSENYLSSLIRYTILMLGLYAASMLVIARLMARQGFTRGNIWVFVGGTLTFYPLIVSLVNTQDTALIFLGMCLWLAGLLLDNDPLGGIGLALTTVRPHITLLLVIPFLFKRRGIFWWFCIATGFLGVISLFVLGFDGVRSYLTILLTAASGEWYGMKELVMINLIGLLRRLAPASDTAVAHAIGWGAYLLTLVGLCVAWARSKVIAEKQAGLAVVLGVFSVTHLHYHDLTLLLLPLLTGILVLVRGKYLREQDAVMLPLGLSLVLLFSNFIPFLQYNFPYLVMVALVLILWFPERLFQRLVVQNKKE